MPFVFNSEENLRAALSRMGLNSGAMEDVMHKVRNKHYQVGLSITVELQLSVLTFEYNI